MVNECGDWRALMQTDVLTCVCVFVCAYWEKSAINKYMPVASNNDRAIFFRG